MISTGVRFQKDDLVVYALRQPSFTSFFFSFFFFKDSLLYRDILRHEENWLSPFGSSVLCPGEGSSIRLCCNLEKEIQFIRSSVLFTMEKEVPVICTITWNWETANPISLCFYNGGRSDHLNHNLEQEVLFICFFTLEKEVILP